MKHICILSVENQIDNVFSESDVITLLMYLKDVNEPYALAIQLFFYLFIRIGELKALRIDDISLDDKCLYLHSQALTERFLNDDLSLSSREVTISNQMKGNTSSGFRIQYLTDEAIDIIKKALVINPDGTFLFEPNDSVMTTDRFNRKL
jgi:integrase